MQANPLDSPLAPTIGFEVKERLLRLQTALLEKNPLMPTLLREIHTKHIKDAAVVSLMTEEEINIVVQGLTRQTAQEIAVASIGKKGTKKPKASLNDAYAEEL